MPQIDAPINKEAKAGPCPCGSKLALEQCCLPLLSGQRKAQTAEQLMRSRYSAHALLQIDYLWQTWSPSQRQRSSPEEIYDWAASCEWLKLEVIATDGGRADDTEGTVTFIALFRHQGQLRHHHETSLFHRTMGCWLYVDHLDV